MAQRFVNAGKILLLVLFCFSLSITVLITDKNFTASRLADKAVAPTMQFFSFIFGLASFPEQFTGDEASHMRDVAWLLRAAGLICLISGLALAKWVKKKELQSLTKQALGVFAVVGFLGLVIPFDSLFRVFHLIFFPQGNWTFPLDSVLIQFYPQEFFAWYALCWFAYALFTACFLAVFSRAFVE